MKVSMVFDDDGLGAALEAAAARSQAGIAQAVYATGGIVPGQGRANASRHASRPCIRGTRPHPRHWPGPERRHRQLPAQHPAHPHAGG